MFYDIPSGNLSISPRGQPHEVFPRFGDIISSMPSPRESLGSQDLGVSADNSVHLLQQTVFLKIFSLGCIGVLTNTFVKTLTSTEACMVLELGKRFFSQNSLKSEECVKPFEQIVQGRLKYYT